MSSRTLFSEYFYPETRHFYYRNLQRQSQSAFLPKGYFEYDFINQYDFNLEGFFLHKKENLKDLLNLNILNNTNLTPKYGKFDMPYIFCPVIPSIDYIATYSQPKTYFHGENTCVSFNEYDKNFDGEKGLWNAIYYDNKELQQNFIKRFHGVRYFIAPDYSKCGDIPEIENQYRQFRARIVSIWLTMNIGAVVIPLVSCANEYGMQYMLEGKDILKPV